MSPLRPALLAALGLAACSDTTHPDVSNGDNEVITTVRLTFTPAGGEPLVFAWDDPEADGSPTIDDVVLADADDYTLAVAFVDALSEPDEDLTPEIAAESDQHQVLFTGTAVDGPAGTGSAAVITQAYADADADGLPVGLESDVSTDRTGSGTLVVTLRHLPPESGAPTKTGDLAATVASEGLDAVPGSTDAQVTFDLTVE